MIKLLISKMIEKHNGYEKFDFSYLEPARCRKSNNKNMRLNLFIPNVDKKKMFGGQTTALDFFMQLGKSLECDLRILSEREVNEEIVKQYDGYEMTNIEQEIEKNSICAFGIEERKKNRLSVREKDYFIATYWTTKYVLNNVAEFQKETFGKATDIIYLIQDFEPGFYRWSSEYLLIDSTYRTDNTIAVFNSSNLQNFFMRMDYKFSDMYCFEPCLNSNLREYLEKDVIVERKKKILVYGRPYVGRNCFSLLINALNQFIEDYEFSNEWEFVSAGADFKDVKLKKGKRLVSVGKLTLDEYAELLSECSVGVSLMCSPHPSYPPLEMAAFGMKTVTNTFQDKDLAAFSDNIISVSDVSFKGIGKAIIQAVEKCPEGFINMRNSAYVKGNAGYSIIVDQIKSKLMR
ncbi:MAG: hypothetical protein IJN92_04855 [Lachnospiraceae bacterium]|nr:hypothetical protein [Lachnospiraceae bacterium]